MTRNLRSVRQRLVFSYNHINHFMIACHQQFCLCSSPSLTIIYMRNQWFLLDILCTMTIFLLTEEYQAELGKYAKNYLPILFNVYTSEENESSDDHQVVIDTVRDYLKVTDQQVHTHCALCTQYI